MKSWKSFSRFTLFVILLASLLAGISAPAFVEESVSAAPVMQAPDVDLTVSMGVINPNPNKNENVVFTITVSNAPGSATATGVTISDVLPVGLVWQSDNSGGTYNSATGIWTIGFMANGGSAALSITAKNTTKESKINSATVSSVETDTVPADNTVSVTVTPKQADLTLSMVTSNEAPSLGDTVIFTITLTNNSATTAATNITVKDLLPAGLTYVSHTISSTGGSYTSGTGLWTITGVGLTPGESRTLTITTTNITKSIKINNVEVIAVDQFDPTSIPANLPLVEDDSASVQIIPPSADLSLAPMLVSNAAPINSEIITFTITISNAGPATATNVTVKDLLPAGLTYISDDSGGSYDKTTGIWAVGSLLSAGVGSSDTLNLVVKVSASGTKTNRAEVWNSNQLDADSAPANGVTTEDDYASKVVTPVVQTADLSLAKSMNILTPNNGDTVIFTIVVRNSGPGSATNVQVKDVLSADFTWQSDNSGGAYNTGSGLWTVGTLANGASKTLKINTMANAPSVRVNWAEVWTSDQFDPDSVIGDGSRTSDDDAGAPLIDLSLTNTVSKANPTAGSNVVFTVTVHNAGPGNATNVQVKYLLPTADFTYVSDDSVGAYNSTTGIWTVGTLAIGASKTLKITETVRIVGTKTYWAEVWKADQPDPDSVPGNNSTTTDDDASVKITSKAVPPSMAIIISEVAWAGTGSATSPNNLTTDEWIELYNPGTTTIDISGWNLIAEFGSLNIVIPNGKQIGPGQFYLLEREDDTTVSDIVADQIYTGALSNSGEVLKLYDSTNVTLRKLIDSANANGGTWPAGSTSISTQYKTMERNGKLADSDTAWYTNTGTLKNGRNASNGPIWGTPKNRNSPAPPTPTPSPTREPTRAPTKIPTRTPTIIPPSGRPILNEILPRPGFDWNQDGKVDVFDEFIEIKNVGNADINMQGWKLDARDSADSSSITLFALPDVILKAGERLVFYGLQTNLHLSDGGETVRLLNPGNTIYDAYTYSIVKAEDQSICRLPDTATGFGTWYEDCVPSPNLVNTSEGGAPSMPEDGYESPVCDLPDTLPADFLIAECHGYGANIWDAYYWDKEGLQGDQYVPENTTKWESFVE